MTPIPERELAEKIVKKIKEDEPIWHYVANWIEPIIKEAMEKEFLRGHEASDIRNVEPIRHQARLEEQERCAKIAEDYPKTAPMTEAAWATPNVCTTIAAKIREQK